MSITQLMGIVSTVPISIPSSSIDQDEKVCILILFFVINEKLVKFYKIMKLLGIVLLIQIILGILTVLNGAQMFIASMHQISSIALISFSIYLLFINKKIN